MKNKKLKSRPVVPPKRAKLKHKKVTVKQRPVKYGRKKI